MGAPAAPGTAATKPESHVTELELAIEIHVLQPQRLAGKHAGQTELQVYEL